MMLIEDGHFLLSDPVSKFIPEFADQKVGVENNGKLELVDVQRPMTVPSRMFNVCRSTGPWSHGPVL